MLLTALVRIHHPGRSLLRVVQLAIQVKMQSRYCTKTRNANQMLGGRRVTLASDKEGRGWDDHHLLLSPALLC
jgi:hypothetical protein